MAALVTQAQADGLAVHQIGIDTNAVRAGFGLADALTVVVLAIGLPGDTAGAARAAGHHEAAPRTRRHSSDLLLPAPAEHRLAA